MDFGVFATQSSRLKVVLERLSDQRGSGLDEGMMLIATDLPYFVKVAIVKSQKILVLVVQALYSVCLAFGEIPDVTVSELIDLVFSILVHGRDKDTALVHNTPLSLI